MKRREFTAKSAAGALVLGAHLIVTLGAGKKAFGPRAEVRPLNGSPALFVDGVPIPPMTYTAYYCERKERGMKCEKDRLDCPAKWRDWSASDPQITPRRRNRRTSQ